MTAPPSAARRMRCGRAREAIHEAGLHEVASHGPAGTSPQAHAGLTTSRTRRSPTTHAGASPAVFAEGKATLLTDGRPTGPGRSPTTSAAGSAMPRIAPQIARPFARAAGGGAPPLRRARRAMRDAVGEAAAMNRGRIAGGRIRPVDPCPPRLPIRAVTEHRVDREAQALILLDALDAPLGEASIAAVTVGTFPCRGGLVTPDGRARR